MIANWKLMNGKKKKLVNENQRKSEVGAQHLHTHSTTWYSVRYLEWFISSSRTAVLCNLKFTLFRVRKMLIKRSLRIWIEIEFQLRSQPKDERFRWQHRRWTSCVASQKLICRCSLAIFNLVQSGRANRRPSYLRLFTFMSLNHERVVISRSH